VGTVGVNVSDRLEPPADAHTRLTEGVLTASSAEPSASVAMTLDVYGHLMEGVDEAPARAMEGLLK
jgi:hypothetical protein